MGNSREITGDHGRLDQITADYRNFTKIMRDKGGNLTGNYREGLHPFKHFQTGANLMKTKILELGLIYAYLSYYIISYRKRKEKEK